MCSWRWFLNTTVIKYLDIPSSNCFTSVVQNQLLPSLAFLSCQFLKTQFLRWTWVITSVCVKNNHISQKFKLKLIDTGWLLGASEVCVWAGEGGGEVWEQNVKSNCFLMPFWNTYPLVPVYVFQKKALCNSNSTTV